MKLFSHSLQSHRNGFSPVSVLRKIGQNIEKIAKKWSILTTSGVKNEFILSIGFKRAVLVFAGERPVS